MRRFLAVAFSLSMLWACQEETVVSSISGNIYSDCSSPIPNAEVALKANAGGSYQDPIILASAVTNSSGYFQFTYELEESESGTGDLILVESSGFTSLIERVELKEDKSFSLYVENIATTYVSLAGTKTWTANDTLFYGWSPASYENYIIQPNNGVLDTINTEVPNIEGEGNFYTLYYGIGEADFNTAREAISLEDSTYQNISLSLEGCEETEQLEITIN